MLSNLIYYITTSYRWLLRCAYCRGFGIQSPSAFSFVCNVVNSHTPYDVYSDLNSKMRSNGLLFCKLGRLYFRLSQFWQPKSAFIDDQDLGMYIHSGCPHTDIRSFDEYTFRLSETHELLVLSIDAIRDDHLFEKLLSAASNQMLLVLEGIYKTRESQELWKKIIGDERTGVTYDLYYCGIIFFDKSKYKQDFKINF